MNDTTLPSLAKPLIADMARDMETLIASHPLRRIEGRLTSVRPGALRCNLHGLSIGDTCQLYDPRTKTKTRAEVIGIDEGEALLSSYGPIAGLSPNTVVAPTWEPLDFLCGPNMLGGVFDGLGCSMDSKQRDSRGMTRRSIEPRTPDPFARPLVQKPVMSQLRALDGLLTIGFGQRLGVFGPAGAGKTSLVGALARNISCDVCILALIGERGRELREFLDRQLPPEFMAKCVVVTATSDRPAMERVNAAHVASSIAEYFRDQGANVLFLFDSATRFARALREVGLAAGEQAVRRGFTPSVYAELPRLIERAGPAPLGSITALYTVLMESEDEEDPIAEEVRSLTDGHLLLSARLGHAGHYPALDILRSNSRLMSEIVQQDHLKAAQKIRSLMAKYEEIELLIQVGEFKSGQDALADEAAAKHNAIEAFLRQGSREVSAYEETTARLIALANEEIPFL